MLVSASFGPVYPAGFPNFGAQLGVLGLAGSPFPCDMAECVKYYSRCAMDEDRIVLQSDVCNYSSS